MNLRARTLMSRIVWTTIVVSAIAMAAMVGTVLLVLSALNQNSIESRLRDQFTAIASTVEVRSDGTVTGSETPFDRIDDTSWIYGADGGLVEGPRVGPKVTRTVEALSGATKATRLDRYERAFLAGPVRVDDQVRAVVVVEASLEPYEATRNAVLVGLLALGLTVTGGSAAVAVWTVRRTLAPVESMAVRAEDWSEHDLDSRFDVTGSDDEFARLGRTLNVLLDRVAGALRNEQQLTAELAHELRTPLTAIRGEAELTLMTDPSPPVAARQRHLVEVVDRMSETITSLLAIARGEHRLDGRTTTTDLADVVHAQAAAWSGIDLDTSRVEAFDIAAPRDLVLRAIGPLVDNAAGFASSIVTITATAADRTVLLAVSDDGPGITEADPESLFESGARGADSAGAGLGLALSRRVARTLGGDVHNTSRSGPTTFTVTLPQA